MSGLPAPSPPDYRCPGCGAADATDVFESAGVPVFVGVLHDDPAAARAAPTGDVRLAFCHRCGLVHNRAFDPARLAFAPGYDSSLAHSPTIRAHLEAVADRLVARYDLAGRGVLEIGCGGGEFLRLLAARGIARGIGIDPAAPAEGRERVGAATLEWRRAWFDPDGDAAAGAWDFACSLSVFEDLPRPLESARGLARLAAARGAAAYVEVFHGARAFERGETWSVHYEQCNYFGAASLAGLFERAGLRPRDAGAAVDGAYLWVELEPGPAAEAPAARLPLPPALAGLAARHAADVAAWTARLGALAAEGRRVVLWGSGGKGISFLAAVPTQGAIACVVDVNPDRQGRWVPGAGLEIVAPEALTEIRPDVVILTNTLYEREIRSRVDALGLSCAFLAA